MKKKDYIRVFILRTIGNLLLLSAISGVFLTFLPAIKAEIVYRRDQITGQKYILVEDKVQEQKTFTGLLDIKEPLTISPLSTDFGIVIPKINANARVVSNVDAASQDAYTEALRRGVAHAAGSVYPGQIGNTFLFAHSVGNFWEVNQWNAVFYLLKELSPGDEVNLFYLGRRYVYIVYDSKIVDPSEVGYLNAQANFPMLTLQTCWPPGTTLKRLLVFARLKSS